MCIIYLFDFSANCVASCKHSSIPLAGFSNCSVCSSSHLIKSRFSCTAWFKCFNRSIFSMLINSPLLIISTVCCSNCSFMLLKSVLIVSSYLQLVFPFLNRKINYYESRSKTLISQIRVQINFYGNLQTILCPHRIDKIAVDLKAIVTYNKLNMFVAKQVKSD